MAFAAFAEVPASKSNPKKEEKSSSSSKKEEKSRSSSSSYVPRTRKRLYVVQPSSFNNIPAIAKMQEKIASYQRKLENCLATFERIISEERFKANSLPKEEREQKMAMINAQVAEFNKKINQLQIELQKELNNAQIEIITKITEAIREIAESVGADVVLNAEVVMYAASDEVEDLTDLVITKVTQVLPDEVHIRLPSLPTFEERK